MRRSDRGPIRRGGSSGAIKFIVALALLAAAYIGVGAYREAIVTAVPDAYPVMRALGYDVAEPLQYGIVINTTVDRVRDENGQWVVYVRGQITNTLDRRKAVPRLQITVTASNAARPLVWTLAPELTSLAPGQQTRFQSRYSTPFAYRDMRAKVRVVEK